MKSYEALMKELGELKVENAGLRGQLDAALKRIEELTAGMAQDDLDCDCGCDGCCPFDCGDMDLLGDSAAELNFDAEMLKAEVMEKLDQAANTAKDVATKVATSKVVKGAVSGCQKLLQKAAEGIDKLDKKD